MFENKYAKLPDEPAPLPIPDTEPSVSSTSNVRNNGPVPVRKRSRNPSKNFTNPSGNLPPTSTISSEDDGSTDESSADEMQTNDENTLRQLRVLQDQVMIF